MFQDQREVAFRSTTALAHWTHRDITRFLQRPKDATALNMSDSSSASVSVFARDRRVVYVSSNAKATPSKMGELVIVLRMRNSAHLPRDGRKAFGECKNREKYVVQLVRLPITTEFEQKHLWWHHFTVLHNCSAKGGRFPKVLFRCTKD